MKKYDDFRLGENTRYHIPKDQYELIKKIIDSEETEGLNSRTILSIKRKINEIEEITGKRFFEKIEAGDSSYSEIQIRTVGETIDKHEVNLSSENEKIKADFKEEANKKKLSLNQIKEPNIEEALKSGLIGAGVSGALNFGFSVFKKCKNENKHIYEYDQEDWKEIGLDVGKNSIKGGVTGVGIYGLTNFASMPAPVAGGYVTAVFCTIELMKKYRKSEMEIEDFLIESECICVEAGLTMSCALIGQAMIPIPIIGAVVGSIVGSIISGPMMDSAKEYLSEKEIKLIRDYNNRYQHVISRLTKEEKEYCLKIVGYFEKLEHLEDFVFDAKVNSLIRLSKSADMAEEYKVEDKLILRSIEDVDALFK